jgi:hypothetical protein
LNLLDVRVGNLTATVTSISAAAPQQISAILPTGLRTGLQPVRLIWNGQDLAPARFLRIVPPGPSVPVIAAVSDAARVGDGKKISSQALTVSFEELPPHAEIRATIDGRPLQEIARRCVVPFIPRHEIDFRLPAGVSGSKRLECWLGKRSLGRTDLLVENDLFARLSRLRPTDFYQAVRRMVWRRQERRVTKVSA